MSYKISDRTISQNQLFRPSGYGERGARSIFLELVFSILRKSRLGYRNGTRIHPLKNSICIKVWQNAQKKHLIPLLIHGRTSTFFVYFSQRVNIFKILIAIYIYSWLYFSFVALYLPLLIHCLLAFPFFVSFMKYISAFIYDNIGRNVAHIFQHLLSFSAFKQGCGTVLLFCRKKLKTFQPILCNNCLYNTGI